jgi:hypothetical protein
MTQEELFEKVQERLPIASVHPLYRAMFEECCENAISNSLESEDDEARILAVLLAFITANSILKSVIGAAVKNAVDGRIAFTYRNQTFIIPHNSILLK